MLIDVPHLTLDDAIAVADDLGGEARMMNDHIWGDFTRKDDALKFADKLLDLNVERMTRERSEANLQQRSNINIPVSERYRLLSSMNRDVKYYLDNGPVHGYDGKLMHQGSLSAHLQMMRQLYDSFPAAQKPD